MSSGRTPNGGRQSPAYSSKPKPGRLGSLRPKRDLTLGAEATKATPSPTSAPGSSGSGPRRQFIPNLAVAGKRQQPVEETPAPRRGGRIQQERNRPQRGGKRGEYEIIQSKGVFSEGPAEGPKIKREFGGGGGGGGSDKAAEAKARPIFKTETGSGEGDDEIVKSLLKEGFVADLPDSDFFPVTLPMEPKMVEVREVVEVKAEVKSEPMEVDEAPAVLPMEAKPPRTIRRTYNAVDVIDEARKGDSRMIFFQLPNVLSKMVADGVAAGEVKREPNEEARKGEHTLERIPEGRAGKLQVLASGAVRLVLGDLCLDVTTGTATSFLQTVAAVEPDEGVLKILGGVEHRLLCAPNVEELCRRLKVDR